MKRTGIKKSKEEINEHVGEADKAFEDRKLKQIRIVGAKETTSHDISWSSTEEIVDERERIAKMLLHRCKHP